MSSPSRPGWVSTSTLLSGFRNRIGAFTDWAWDYFSKSRGSQVLDRSDQARIDWGDDPIEEVDATAEAIPADLH